MRFAFYVSGKATRLLNTIKMINDHHLDLTKSISFVLIDNVENNELKKVCTDNRIDHIEIDLNPIEKSKRSIFISDKLLTILEAKKVDYLFIFCTLLLKGKLIDLYHNRIINFHPSLLPSYKGFMAIDHALENNAFLFGNTAHFINEKPDDGPIIMQSLLQRSRFTQYDDVLDMQVVMLIQIMFWLSEKRIKVSNNKVFVRNANYEVGKYVPQIELNI